MSIEMQDALIWERESFDTAAQTASETIETEAGSEVVEAEFESAGPRRKSACRRLRPAPAALSAETFQDRALRFAELLVPQRLGCLSDNPATSSASPPGRRPLPPSGS